MTLLVSMVALVVDGGSLMEERRHAQAIADASALAAAADLYTNYGTNSGADPKGSAAASAQAIANANGFTNDGVQSVVTVNLSPQNYQGGPNVGSALPPDTSRSLFSTTRTARSAASLVPAPSPSALAPSRAANGFPPTPTPWR